MKTIGVVTSGGDAPGMNAAVRSVVRSGLDANFRVLGIRRGYNGLLYGDMVEMDYHSVSNIINRGGTILGTARCPEFNSKEGVEKARQVCAQMEIDGIVVIGGDGSFRGALDLTNVGVACVGIPGTIDNDIGCSEYTIGYDTAMNTAMDCIDKLRDTTQSHDRCSVVEVMGRGAGWIALNVGLACGAIAISTSEKPMTRDDVVGRIYEAQKSGRHHFIIVISEAIGDADGLAKHIEKATSIESRGTVLGHIQRGGSPTLRDRVLACEMGAYAVELLRQGSGGRVIAMNDNKIVNYDIQSALKMTKQFNDRLYHIANEISI